MCFLAPLPCGGPSCLNFLSCRSYSSSQSHPFPPPLRTPLFHFQPTVSPSAPVGLPDPCLLVLIFAKPHCRFFFPPFQCVFCWQPAIAALRPFDIFPIFFFVLFSSIFCPRPQNRVLPLSPPFNPPPRTGPQIKRTFSDFVSLKRVPASSFFLPQVAQCWIAPLLGKRDLFFLHV